jgi:hypothetical protein
MSLDLIRTTVTQSPDGIPLQQASHNRLGFAPAHVVWEAEGVPEDTLVHRVDIFIVKRWKPCHHLI